MSWHPISNILDGWIPEQFHCRSTMARNTGRDKRPVSRGPEIQGRKNQSVRRKAAKGKETMEQEKRSGMKGDRHHLLRLERGGENTYAPLFSPELTCEGMESKQGRNRPLCEKTSVSIQFDRSSQNVVRGRLSLGIRQNTCDQM